MRESLANRSDKGLSTYPDKIPRGRNGKKWYRFLHGRDLIEDVEYDDEEEKGSDAEGAVREDAEAVFKCREPSEALLHHFGTVSEPARSSTVEDSTDCSVHGIFEASHHLTALFDTLLAHTTSHLAGTGSTSSYRSLPLTLAICSACPFG